ncbi:MAG: helix-turn-helix domain-containing protein [Methylococcaceae bacterium]
MKTLDTKEAAEFLKISVRTLHREIKKGTIPVGKSSQRRKVFLECDLVRYIRGEDNQSRGLSVIDGGLSTQENNQWQSINKKRVVSGQSISLTQAASELDKVLAHKTSKERKNCTISLKHSHGGKRS